MHCYSNTIHTIPCTHVIVLICGCCISVTAILEYFDVTSLIQLQISNGWGFVSKTDRKGAAIYFFCSSVVPLHAKRWKVATK